MMFKKSVLYVVLFVAVIVMSSCWLFPGDNDEMHGYWWSINNDGIICTSKDDSNAMLMEVKSEESPFCLVINSMGDAGVEYEFSIDEANKKITIKGIPNYEYDGTNMTQSGTTDVTYIYYLDAENSTTDDKFTWYIIDDNGEAGDIVYDWRRYF